MLGELQRRDDDEPRHSHSFFFAFDAHFFLHDSDDNNDNDNVFERSAILRRKHDETQPSGVLQHGQAVPWLKKIRIHGRGWKSFNESLYSSFPAGVEVFV